MNSAQFQGSAKSTPFAPLQAPDLTGAMRQQLNDQLRWMREDQQMVISDRRQYAAAMDQQMQTARGFNDKNLEALAGMSKTLTDTLLQAKKDREQNDLEEGLMLNYQYGPPDGMMAEFEENEKKLIGARDVTNIYADRLAKNGAPPEVVEKFRNLNGWKRYGFMIGVAQDAGQKWASFLEERLQNDDQTKVTLPDGRVITPSQARDKPELAASTVELRKLFLRMTGLTGANPALLNKYLFPNMRQGEDPVIGARYRGILTEKAEAELEEAQGLLVTGLKTPGSAAAAWNAFISQASTILDPKNLKPIGFGGSRRLADVLSRELAKAGELSMEARQEIMASNIPGSTTETWGSKFPQLFIGLDDEIRDAKEKELAAQDRAEDREWKNYEEQVISSATEMGGLTKAQKDDIIEKFGKYGRTIPPSIAGLVTQEEKVDEQAEDEIKALLASGRGITMEDLMTRGYSNNIILKYRDEVRKYEVTVEKNPAFKSAEDGLKQFLRSIARYALSPNEKETWTLSYVQGYAVQKLRDLTIQYTRETGDPTKAIAQAETVVRNMINDGRPSSKGKGTGPFAFESAPGNDNIPKTNGDFVGIFGKIDRDRAGIQVLRADFNRVVSTYRADQANALKKPGLLSERDLNRLEKLREDPNLGFPATVLWISEQSKLSPWDIAEQQLQANNRKPLVPPPTIEWSRQQPPQIQRLLNWAPSANRTNRAFSGSQWNASKVPNNWGVLVEQAAKKYGLDPALLAGLLHQESGNWNPKAASGVGPVGLAQINVDTAAEAGISLQDRTDPKKSIFAGARILSQRLAAANGDLTLALRMYNMGVAGARSSPGGYPGDRESIEYPSKVLKMAAIYGYGFGTGSPYRRQEMMNPRLGYRSPTLDRLANTERLVPTKPGLCVTAVLNTLAANGLPNPQATGDDPGNNPRGLAAQLVRRYGWKPLPGIGRPQTIISPYGKFTANVMTNDEYQRAVQAGRIPSGALSFATQWNDWNGNSPRSKGFDVAIVRNRGQNHFNGSMLGSQVYGDQKLVFVLVHSSGGR